MNEAEKIAVKQVLLSKGWEYIEAILEEEANEVKKIKTEGKRYEDIAVETIANDKVSKALKATLRRLNAIKNDVKTTPVVYK
jgi:cell fate (sporulation/competence/biofilm development) regulator YmcA (YheA/YmcA/DUF963 family)